MPKGDRTKYPGLKPPRGKPDKTYTYIPAPPAPVEPEPASIKSAYLPSPKILNNVEPPRTNQTAMTAGKVGEAEPYIFGRCIADPIIVAADDSGRYLYVDMLWSVGEIDYLEYMLVNNQSVGRVDALGKVEHFEGTTNQTASTIMVNLKGEYDALPNKAHTVAPYIVGEGVMEKAMIRGIKLLDPRDSPMVPTYSTNPALAIAKMFSDCGYTINWASISTAADYCDELIGASSPQVKRWEIGGQLRTKKPLSEWAHVLAQHANCFIDVQGGELTLTPDDVRSSVHTVTADDMIAGSVRLTHPRGSSVPDAVTVIGKSADGDRISYTYGTSSGAGTETTINMPFYQTVHTCGRKAEETYNKARMRKLEFTSFDNSIKRTIGDLGTITNSQYGLSGALFALTDQKQLSGGRWRRTYVEYSASNYSDTVYDETDAAIPPGSNPSEIPDGPQPTAVEELVTIGGVTQSRFKITFMGIEWPYLKDYRVYVYADKSILSGSTVILNTHVEHIGLTQHTVYTTGPIESGVTYYVLTFVRSNTDEYGDYSFTTITSTQSPNSQLSYGTLTNMHVYILDGDAQYATSSNGVTWSNRFTDSPIPAWSASETWLGNQTFESEFQSAAWDSGNTWDGLWKFTDLNISELNNATRGNWVALSADASPLSFTSYAGTSKSAQAQWMKAICSVTDSPLSAGDGIHVKLPIPVSFTLGG